MRKLRDTPRMLIGLALVSVQASGLVSCARWRMAGEASGARTELVAVWFRGMHLINAHPEHEVVGIVLGEGRTDLPPPTAASLEEWLAGAQVVSSFRSAREAKLVTEGLQRDHRVIWYRAMYDGHWTFVAEKPPERDVLPYDERLGPDNRFHRQPIGEADSGHQTTFSLSLLPPPLQQRGVAVAVSRPKANSFVFLIPSDCTTSAFHSWEDIEARLGAKVPQHMWYWGPEGRKRMAWEQRDALR